MNTAQLLHFTKQDLVDRYAGSALGAVWTLIFPLVNIFVFVFVFSGIMQARLPGDHGPFGYSIYLVSGLVAWLAFSNSVSRATGSFVEKSGIIAKVPLRLPQLPFHVLLSEAVIYAIAMGIFGVFLVFIGYEFGPVLLWLLPVFAVQQLAAYGLGLTFAVLNVFLKDVQQFVAVLLQLWFWFTPIVYVDSIIPESVRWVLLFNPMYPVIDAYHTIVVWGKAPEALPLAGFTAGAIALLLFSRWLFGRLERDLRDCL